VPEGTEPRIGFRLNTASSSSELVSIGVDGRCERHTQSKEA